MLKKRIIKGIILTIIVLIICILNAEKCEAGTDEFHYLSVYNPVKFSAIQADGGEHLQYVSYISYEGNDTKNSFFCNKLGYPPILANITENYESEGSPDISYVTTFNKQDTINAQIAYAMKIGVLPGNLDGNYDSWKDLQEIIWDAKRDTTEDGVLNSDANVPAYDTSEYVPIEVQRFRKVYEQIFVPTIGNGLSVFNIEDKDASLFVDQNDGTYIYGPFQLKVNCKAPQEVIDYLIDEIMEEGSFKYIQYEDVPFDKSEAYIENYRKFHKSIDDNFIAKGISDGNKKKLKYSINQANKDQESYSTIIVDKHGNPIDFPKVTPSNGVDDSGNNFFIKFYPANGGAIINLGDGEHDAELFNLKIKYGSYVNYKEHLQLGAFYTKGVIASISFDRIAVDGEPEILDEATGVVSRYNVGDLRVRWRRIGDTGINNETTADDPILWQAFLREISSPTRLKIYDYNSRNFISGAVLQHDRGNNDDYYYLNGYYNNLRSVGFSTKLATGSNEGESVIHTPFQFAGESEITLPEETGAIKENFGFPLWRTVELQKFRGIVKEVNRATFTSTGTYKYKYVTKEAEEAYTDENGVYHEAVPEEWEWRYKYDNWSETDTVYRYRWTELSKEQIESYNGLGYIKKDNSPVQTTGTENAYTKPSVSPKKSGYSYSEVHEDIDENAWSIVEIYGGKASEVNRPSSVQGMSEGMTAYGFEYKNVDSKWYCANLFDRYEPRVDLGNALGQDHTYTAKSGAANGEYDVWLPKDFSTPMYFNDIHGYIDYMRAREDSQKLGEGLQTFISFDITAAHVDYGATHGEGTIFKYGTRVETESVALPHLKIAEAFGGNVWKESVDVKEAAEKNLDGIFNTGDKYGKGREESYPAVKVDLYECDIDYKEPQRNLFITEADVHPGRYLTSTFTDKNGNYRFYGKIKGQINTPLINPLKKYFVKFVYNGQIYAQTLYNATIDAEYGPYLEKTSKAIDEYRDQFNKRFETIYADSNNYTYTGQRYTGCNGTEKQNYTYTGRAYGLKHTVKEAQDGVRNDPSADPALDTFEEQYNLFMYKNTHPDFITTMVEYQFQNQNDPFNPELEKPITYGTGEIVSADIDKDWEHMPGEFIDYDYSGLSPSVAAYLKDCMIEASVPYVDYTHDLTVYGSNVGRTNLHQKFPLQPTFNLKDMHRTYMDHYRKWTLVYREETVTYQPTQADADAKYRVPAEIAKYIGNARYPVGTQVLLFVYEGEEFYRIEYEDEEGHAKSETVKVASLTDIDLKDSGMKLASGSHESEPYVPPEEPGHDDPTPGQQTYTLKYLYWDYVHVDLVHDIDHYYEPPREAYINLYNKTFDLRHSWSFGVYQRNYNEVALAKDLYKVTMVTNGKKEVYSYSGQVKNEDCGQYNIVGSGEYAGVAKINRPLNGGSPYVREVRKSDYLYDEDLAYGNNEHDKNIQAYLTYKISIQNLGPYTVRINEIADYYDSDNLEFDGVRDENGKLIVDNNKKYQIATHTQNIDGQITTSKYTYASNTLDDAGHNPNTEYIGVYSESAYANGGNKDESFAIANSDIDNEGKPYHLDTLYIRGNDNGKDAGVPSVTYNSTTKEEKPMYELVSGQWVTIFVAFKVKNNALEKGITKFANQIKLDQISPDFINELATVGKNNFAEINSYSTYYTDDMPDDAPDTVEKTYERPYGEGYIRYGKGRAELLTKDKELIRVETNPDICIAGVVDVYSNPGSFTERDVEVVYSESRKYKDIQFKDFSYIKITRPVSTDEHFYPRVNRDDPDEEALLPYEPDTSKAPTIRFILDDQQIRKISGIVFEDNRNVTSDGSPIGDGEIGAGDTPIDGVTVQLVELIQDVDYDGTFTGQYIGEKVWDEYEYAGEQDYDLIIGNDKDEYYSGKGVVKYILNAPQELTQIYKNPEELNGDAIGSGRYCFAGIPSGDFVIRFLYGDTTRTVLTNGTVNQDIDGDVKETAAVNALVGENGYNVKSYNGQDYKSTVYQRKLNSNSSTDYQVNQAEISYNMKDGNAVKGYIDTLNQDYASAYNYNNSKLRDKSQFYNGEIYSAGQPINNNGNLQVSGNVQGVAPRNNINNSYGSMWRYDRIATEDKQKLSDANDLYGYRQRGIDYAQGYTTGKSEDVKTLMNYRAEVLSSFERLTSHEDGNGAPSAAVQKAMLKEFIENTYMVAQSGIISMNNEYEGLNDNDENIRHGNIDDSTKLHMVTGGKPHENHAKGVDLGLVERPRAQVKLTKEVSNLEIKLADGQTLFNSNTQMKDLIFDEHVGHEINYDKPNVGPILEKVRVKLKTQSQPELVQATMDDEIMDGATINVTYHLQVENVGEVDYLDRDFYYYGRKSGAVTEPVRTKVVRVIDYVANDLSYDSSKQNADAHWEVYTPSDVIGSRITIDANKNNKVDDAIPGANNFVDAVPATHDGLINRIQPRDGNVSSQEGKFYDKMNRDYVTRTYAHEVETYNTIIATKDLNDELLPTIYVKGKDALANQNVDKTTLILTTTITASGNSEDLTYNNLAEVIETSNPYGRRMQFSIAGNQEMANQDINDAGIGDGEKQDHHGYSASKITQPREIDADSAQQVVILPPTGSPEYRNTVLTIITTAIATIIVLVGAVIIKKKVYEK